MRDGLPICEFAFPGSLRDELVAAVLRGEKTATSSLRHEYGPNSAEPLPEVGMRSVVVDSDGRSVAIIETVDVRVVRAGDVDEQFAIDEGEGFRSVADWRAAHERFWSSAAYRQDVGAVTVDDDTAVVCQRFRLIELL
jgi:uncharacterized protein YhfF